VALVEDAPLDVVALVEAHFTPLATISPSVTSLATAGWQALDDGLQPAPD
jgi:hypothetical protein